MEAMTPHCLSRSRGPLTRPGGLTLATLATFCFFSEGFFSGLPDGGGDISTADEGVSGSIILRVQIYQLVSAMIKGRQQMQILSRYTFYGD